MAIKKGITLLSILLFVIAAFTLTKTTNAQAMVIGQRFEGQDRYETAVNMSKNGWPGGAQNVVIATGEDFPDALCAAPLAKMVNAPILLTEAGNLNSNVASELARLKPQKAYIIGGTGAISKGIQDKITSMGIECIRLSGSDRYGTSAAVAGEMKNKGEAVVATGEYFPDALSIGSWAAAKCVPILLTTKQSIPQDIMNFINKNHTKVDYVIGGSGVVADSVVNKFPNTRRIAGADRYATNVAVLSMLSGDFQFSKVYMATGEDFPDALSGSVLAAASSSPIVLVSPASYCNTKAFIETKMDKLNNVYLLGGQNAVDNYTVGEILPQLVVGIDIGMPAASVGLNKQMKASINAVTVSGSRISADISCSVDDQSVADIDSSGMITGLKNGDTKITATLGGLTASKAVSVRDSRLIVIDPGHGGWDGGASAVGLDGSILYAYREAVLNLQVAEKLEAKLKSEGYTVVMTRTDDSYMSLTDRAEFANNLNPDLFISVHHDSLTKSSSGTSAFFSSYRPDIDMEGLYAVASDSGPVYGTDGRIIGNLSKGKSYPYVNELNGDIYIIYNNIQAKVSIDDVMVYDNNPSSVSAESQKLAEAINKNISDLGLIARGAKDENYAVLRLTNGVSTLFEVGFISNPYEFQKISTSTFQDGVAEGVTRAIDDFFSQIN